MYVNVVIIKPVVINATNTMPSPAELSRVLLIARFHVKPSHAPSAPTAHKDRRYQDDLWTLPTP